MTGQAAQVPEQDLPCCFHVPAPVRLGLVCPASRDQFEHTLMTAEPQACEEDRVHVEEIAGQQPLRKNARQEVSTSRGAGPRRPARKTRRTVASLTW
jgi:hypothetical protein